MNFQAVRDGVASGSGSTTQQPLLRSALAGHKLQAEQAIEGPWALEQAPEAARMMDERLCFCGSSSCTGLLEWSGRSCVPRGAPAARGCWNGGREDVFLRELPLPGLLDWRGRSCVPRGAPAARGCKIVGREDVFLGELPLRGADGMVGEDLCF